MTVERIGTALQTLDEILGRPQLDPNPAREDFKAHVETLDSIVSLVDAELIGPLDAALAEIESQPEPAEEIATPGEVRELITAGLADPLRFAALGRLDDAQARFEQAIALIEGSYGDRHPPLVHDWWGLAQVQARRGLAVPSAHARDNARRLARLLLPEAHPVRLEIEAAPLPADGG